MAYPLLVIEDDLDTRDALTLLLSRWGYPNLSAANRDDAMSILKRDSVELILLDVFMPGCPVYPFLQACSAITPRPKVVLISAYPQELERLGPLVYRCLAKPIDPKELKTLVNEIMAPSEPDNETAPAIKQGPLFSSF